MVVTVRDLDDRLPRFRRDGVAVVSVPFHPGRGGLLGATKTTDYATAVVAKAIANRRRAFEALYELPNGEIGEGATSNLFLVRRGRIVTPPLSAGVLPGVTRDRVLALARNAGIPLSERRVTIDEIARSEEAFLTATTIEILPIRSLNGRRIGAAARRTTRALQQAFCALHPPGECMDEV